MNLVCGMKRNKFTATERDRISFVLDRAFVHLEAWFQWFNTTQSGKDMSSYFGHGRDNATMRELNPKRKEYDSIAKLLSNFEILNQMHFDDAHGTYLDFGNHTEKCSFDLVRSNGKQPLCKSRARPGSFRIAKIELMMHPIGEAQFMNINYMILSSLHHYSKENGPYRDKAKIIYNDLRNNLIINVVKNYQQIGYF
ncbi:unnamed protein product [Camellia sinensis]